MKEGESLPVWVRQRGEGGEQNIIGKKAGTAGTAGRVCLGWKIRSRNCELISSEYLSSGCQIIVCNMGFKVLLMYWSECGHEYCVFGTHQNY